LKEASSAKDMFNAVFAVLWRTNVVNASLLRRTSCCIATLSRLRMLGESLDCWLEKWANNDTTAPNLKDKWKDELLDQGIGNMQALDKRARHQDSWEELCVAVDGDIRANLQDWKEKVFVKRNPQFTPFNGDLLNNYIQKQSEFLNIQEYKSSLDTFAIALDAQLESSAARKVESALKVKMRSVLIGASGCGKTYAIGCLAYSRLCCYFTPLQMDLFPMLLTILLLQELDLDL
jgi:hypothetical protein